MTWKKLAEVIAREASYRSAKERGKRSFFRLTGGSMLKYNALLIAIFTFLSVSMGFAAFAGRELSIVMLTILSLMEMMMGILIMALNTQVLISDKLLDPVFRLPISEEDVRKALSWVGIYWGEAALPFAVIPAGIIMSLILKDAIFFLSSLLIALMALLLSLGLGYLVGSLASRYTRSLKGRTISTTVWILALGIGFLIGPVSSMVEESLSSNLGMIGWIPPISFVFMFQDPIALVTSLASLLLSYLLLKYGTDRFWNAATRGEVPLPKVSAKWSIRYGLMAAILRELKIAVRTPRILASVIIYSVLFPFSILFPGLSASGLPAGFKEYIPILALAVGGLEGFSLLYFYIMEAAGAKSLYSLPLRRSDIAILKFLAYSVVNVPLIIAVSVAILLFPSAGILSFLIYLGSFAGSSLMNSLIYANMLPEEPSHWSSETFGRNIIGILMMGEIGFYFLVGIMAFLIPGAMEKTLISLISLAAIWLIDAFLYKWSRRII